MKLFVWALFALLPWLPWVGDWALRWTEGNEALQVAFAMFIFPLVMNGVQYWIIDSFIMDKSRGKGEADGQRYERVRQESGEDEEGSEEREDDEETISAESVRGKGEGLQEPPLLTELNPTPIPERGDEEDDGRRRPSSPG